MTRKLVIELSGVAGSRACWPHSSSTSLHGRSPPLPGCRSRRPDRRSASRWPAVLLDTETPLRRRAGESLNLLSRDRTSERARVYLLR